MAGVLISRSFSLFPTKTLALRYLIRMLALFSRVASKMSCDRINKKFGYVSLFLGVWQDPGSYKRLNEAELFLRFHYDLEVHDGLIAE